MGICPHQANSGDKHMSDQPKQKRQMTEEKREIIRDLWNKGHSSSQIAVVVGLSRNAVIGAVHRMKKKGVEINAKERPVSKKKEVIEIIENDYGGYYGEPVDILGLRMHSCRFIVEEGTPYTTKYCNKKSWQASYCKEHYKVCYIPINKRSKETDIHNTRT